MSHQDVNVMVLISISIAIGGFVVPWVLAGLGCLIAKAVAWMFDKRVSMNDTSFARWLNKTIRRGYSADYFDDTALASFYIFLTTIASILLYHVGVLRIIAVLAISVFTFMHAGRWMIRTAKSLDKIKDISHQHNDSEKEG